MEGLEYKGIAELRGLLDSGGLDTVGLAAFYLDRIAALDRDGPRVNAVLELAPKVLDEAAALDRELRAGRARGPLHGIPILVKANIDCGNGLAATAGSLALEGHRPARAAGVVDRLRAAGALVLGTTNLSEWANFRGKRSTSGWSSLGGQTRNPHALDRSPCGSSSGSGAAVAAGFCAAAVGTETDGSIVCPAQTNGIVGVKPTVGLVGRSGIIPISASQDTAGPMARSVWDAALLLGAMAGPDSRDPSTAASLAPGGARGLADYRPSLDPRSLAGARIGVPRALAGTDPRVTAILEAALEAMRGAGATVLDAKLGPSAAFGEAELEVMLHEYRAGLGDYLAGCVDLPLRDLPSLIRYNYDNRGRILAHFGQEWLEEALRREGPGSRGHRRARGRCLRLARRGLDAALARGRFDCLVLPTGGPAWLIDPVNGDGGRSWDMDSTSHAAVAGYPHVTVPAGFVRGLPVGLSFIGRAWTEARLLGLAYAFEGITRAWRPPRFPATAELPNPERKGEGS